MEVENKAKQPSFPSNYVTIHQLRQRWLQQQHHQSPSSLSSPSTVIPVSNHRDNGDVIESSSAAAAAASIKPPQNDAVSAHSSSPPPVTTPSSYNNNNKPPFSSISSSSGGGGFKKKPQNDAVSPPPAKTKSPSSSLSSSSHQQQQSSSSSLLLPTVISESNHRDNGDVVDSSSSIAVSKRPQNDAVFARSSPPAVPSSYNTNNRVASVESSSAASKRNPQNDNVSARFSKSPSSYYSKNKTPFSSISSSGGGGFNKKPQNDIVSPPPLTKTKSPLISQNRIVSKALKETIFGKGRGPHRAPTPQKPVLETEPEHTDSVTNTSTLGIDSANDVTDKPISVGSNNQLSKKKKRIHKKKNHKRVTGANSLTETDPKLELEVEALMVGEKEQELGGGRISDKSKMGLELEQVVEVEKKQKPRESRGRRNWGNKKREGEFEVKMASFDQNKAGVGDNVVEPKAEPELEAVRESEMGQELEEVVVVEKKQQLQMRESRGCRDWNKKRLMEYIDKTASFGQNKQAVGDNYVVEPELEVEMEVVVWKGQESPELGGCRKSNKKVVRESKMAPELEEVVDKKHISMERRRAVWKYKPKTASFGQYDSTNSSNNVDNNVDVGGGGKAVEDDKVVGNVYGGGDAKAVEVDKVVGNGDAVKENSTWASGKLDHQGKQSVKAASFDQDQDTSESPVKKRGAVNTNYNNNTNYNRYRNATGNVGSNWRMGSGRFRGHGLQRPLYSKPLVSSRQGEVWVKKGEYIKPNLSSS